MKPYIMTPVLRPETPSQEAYNRAFGPTRATIERAFGVLKRRFRYGPFVFVISLSMVGYIQTV